MKVTDITPGLVYAVPANRMSGARRGSYGVGAAAQVRDGQIAVPFLVDEVGKFRRRQSGACTTEIVSDYHTTTILGLFPDIMVMLGKNLPENQYRRGYDRYGSRRTGHHIADAKWPGYPSGISLTDKKMMWYPEQDIVSPVDIIMPWADFLKRREEWVFVANEVEAYGARLNELRKQIHDMMGPVMEGHASMQRTVKTTVNMRVPSGQRLAYDHPQLMFEQMYDVQLMITDLSVDVRRVLDPLLKEMAAIQKKLECAV